MSLTSNHFNVIFKNRFYHKYFSVTYGNNKMEVSKNVLGHMKLTGLGRIHLEKGTGAYSPGVLSFETNAGVKHYIWVALGKLRIHSSFPTSNSDGVVVGTQT